METPEEKIATKGSWIWGKDSNCNSHTSQVLRRLKRDLVVVMGRSWSSRSKWMTHSWELRMTRSTSVSISFASWTIYCIARLLNVAHTSLPVHESHKRIQTQRTNERIRLVSGERDVLELLAPSSRLPEQWDSRTKRLLFQRDWVR
jgi:hypothetical protein